MGVFIRGGSLKKMKIENAKHKIVDKLAIGNMYNIPIFELYLNSYLKRRGR